MPVGVLRDQMVWLGGRDLTGRMNAVTLEVSAEIEDDTTFGDTTRSNLPGMTSVTCAVAGLYDPDATEQALFDGIGAAAEPMSLAAVGAAEGSLAYTFLAGRASYEPFSGVAVGGRHGFSLDAVGAGSPLVRGTLMANRTGVGAAGNSAARNLGAVGASQNLYAALHVLSVGGTTPSLTVTVESDDASGFASPTTRITFSAASAIGSEWATPVAGSIADTWWRVAWTVGGTAADFDFVVVIGIQ